MSLPIALGIIAVIIVCCFVVSSCFGKESHVIGKAEDIKVPEVAYAADDALSDISSDLETAAQHVRSSYMGELYGIDADAWVAAYMPRVKFSVLASKRDVDDENKAYASVSITHPDTVALTQELMSGSASSSSYSQMGNDAIEALSRVGDVSTTETLTFLNEDGRWTPDEVSRGTMVRYLYGNVM